MIVCLCKGVSCGAIRRAIDAGAASVAEVGRSCGAGTDCGGCRCDIEEMLDEARGDRSGARHLPMLTIAIDAA